MSNRSTTMTYDDIAKAINALPRQHVTLGYGTLSMVGTLTGTAVAQDIFQVPANSAVKVTGCYFKKVVGGTATATAPYWTIAKVTPISGIGTGTATAFGTCAWGTDADAKYVNFSVTSTTAAAGDIIRLLTNPGTTSNASQTVTNVTLEYQEDWS